MNIRIKFNFQTFSRFDKTSPRKRKIYIDADNGTEITSFELVYTEKDPNEYGRWWLVYASMVDQETMDYKKCHSFTDDKNVTFVSSRIDGNQSLDSTVSFYAYPYVSNI